MFPHDADKNCFEGQTYALKEIMAEAAAQFFHTCLQEAGWQPADIQHFFTHQVSISTFQLIARLGHIDPNCCEQVFTHFGNTAAASIPLAMHQRYLRGEIKKGDKMALLGLAAGVSVSVQLLVW